MKCKNCGNGIITLTSITPVGALKHYNGSYYCTGNRTHAEPEEDQNLSTPEPDPVKNKNPPVWELVIQDMQERDRIGEQRYGVRLQAGNGRDALVDAFQEGLDLVVYLRQEIEERAGLYAVIADMFRVAGLSLPDLEYKDKSKLLKHMEWRLDEAVAAISQRDTLYRERKGEVWFWSSGKPGDGDDANTIKCPILIQPEDLLPMWLLWQEPTVPTPGSIGSPIPMVLHCLRCGAQHIDKEETESEYNTRVGVYGLLQDPGRTKRWKNPPHKSHLCHNCECIWRPAEVYTIGVQSVVPGENDTWLAG